MRAKVVRKAWGSTSKSGTLAHMGNRVPPLKYGVSVANFGTYSDLARFVKLALAAENAGWEGVFVWDHLAFAWGRPTADPWILLAAAASATERVLLGTLVTPLPRRRFQDIALTVATLDRLSGGRVVFGSGLGGNEREFAAFGEETDERVRAKKLDEGLEVLRQLWSGERVFYKGEYVKTHFVQLMPLPLQQPLPIWIGGNAPRALRRAARFDGWVANTTAPHEMTMTPDELAQKLEIVLRARTVDTPFDVIAQGHTEPGETELPAAYSTAGATWWLDSIHDQRGDFDAMLRRVGEGPPR
jgi:alkanesulfonate monooxygenase SsuD/methylene tetrahydromethanopterin reductase-like flavin-dependent oxidoreductase (luciferase family)